MNTGNPQVDNYFLPTKFARELCKKVQLYPVEEIYNITDELDLKHWNMMIERLQEFQQLSMFGSLDDALYAYSGVDLFDEQEKALELIHKTTPMWANGHIADTLLARISFTEDPKVMTQAATLLMEGLGIKKESAGNGTIPLDVFLHHEKEKK